MLVLHLYIWLAPASRGLPVVYFSGQPKPDQQQRRPPLLTPSSQPTINQNECEAKRKCPTASNGEEGNLFSRDMMIPEGIKAEGQT